MRFRLTDENAGIAVSRISSCRTVEQRNNSLIYKNPTKLKFVGFIILVIKLNRNKILKKSVFSWFDRNSV